ncbi:hypothetical protein ACLEDY_06190 [Lonsdalea quercina]|uniref:hypothetical protein n=1 Tax=Lonsdalea quercina TaxID=71657 RepID=UPI0039755587
MLYMASDAVNTLAGNLEGFYPAGLRPDINRGNTLTYDTITNGVYKTGYYGVRWLNPTGIVPQGPEIDFDRAQNRRTRRGETK